MSSAEQILHALASRSPYEVLVSWQCDGLVGLGLASGLVGFNELAGNFVGHALELGERDVGRLGGSGFEDGSAATDRLGVVSGENNTGSRIFTRPLNTLAPSSRKHTRSQAIEARIRLLLGIMEQLPLIRAEIRTTHKLDA